MTLADDLATLRSFAGASPRRSAALDRVEAELARLERHPDAWSQQAFDQQKRRAEAAEAEVARLRDGLRMIQMKPYRADEVARALLAEDGAAACEHDYVFMEVSPPERGFYRCDKCGSFSADGVYPRFGGAA